MTTITESMFLAWADGAGMSLDPKYPHSAVLVFRAGAEQARFWEVPPEPECRPSFILSLLELMGDWKECYVWRHLGRWPDRAEPGRINDAVELQMLEGLGMPLGTADVLTFARDDSARLVTLLFLTTIFGWSVSDDLYIVPDHGRYIVQTDHHAVIHVAFRSEEDVDEWVRRMAERGFALPDDLPDSTFKEPDWMKRESSE